MKYKHSKKNIYEKINGSVVWKKHSGKHYWLKTNSTMSVMLCAGTIFVKKTPD